MNLQRVSGRGCWKGNGMARVPWSRAEGVGRSSWAIDGAKQDFRRNHFYTRQPVITCH